MGVIDEKDGKKEFINRVMVGDCPICGSKKTRDCEESPLNDSLVGLCEDCSSIWCLECGTVFEKGQKECKHWAVCENCKFLSSNGKCTGDISIRDCSIIQDWKTGESN